MQEDGSTSKEKNKQARQNRRKERKKLQQDRTTLQCLFVKDEMQINPMI